MDVQGSQFHLLDGRPDWGRCTDVTHGHTLAEMWADAADAGPSTVLSDWEYDQAGRVLRLRRDAPLFRRAGRSDPLQLTARRGAGRDGYGNWFWIDDTGTAIRWLVSGQRTAATWWSTADLTRGCTCTAPTTAHLFAGACSCPPPALTLRGLAVTTHHYLLAGYWAAEEAGILVFDLQAGGAPVRMLWPAGFRPWDLCDCDDGGALILDRDNAAYCRLDAHLRLRGTRPDRVSAFGPAAGGAAARLIAGPIHPTATALRDAHGRPVPATSIEPGPGGAVLILGHRDSGPASTLYCFDGDHLRWQTSLADIVEVVDDRDPSAAEFRYSVIGHDMAYLSTGGPLQPPVLYVADAHGEQVVAFILDPDTGRLLPHDDFLPMRQWAGRALVRAGGALWYDFGERWITVAPFAEQRFAATATLTTPAQFGDPAGLSADSFDSGLPGCLWHRLLLDAHRPSGTSITIQARACDDPELLTNAQWVAQPTPYLRGGGSELPWADPWADRRGDARDPRPLPDGMGTYELLFQGVAGRYLQLELTISGGGRATPLIRSLRAWYPRFSYVEHYLPSVYAENDLPDLFLQRFLANPEGLFTALEEKIEHSHLLLDARTAPAADLPWLAAWFGLALDPQWDETHRRFLIRHVDRFYRLRGTVTGLVATLRAYLQATLDEGIFASAQAGAGGVRLVERFLTRDTGGAAYGAPAERPDPDPMTRAANAAHRFDVLVPASLSADQHAMVQRIVAANGPAHAAFALRTFDELFVIGQARLGLDTELGSAPLFQPLLMGSVGLAGGYLGYPHPFELTDRAVSDRDRIGSLPAL